MSDPTSPTDPEPQANPFHPYVGLRARATAYELWFGVTVPAVEGTICAVVERPGSTQGIQDIQVWLLLDDGRHTNRPLPRVTLVDPALAAERLARAARGAR